MTRLPCGLHRLHQARQAVADLVVTEAADQGQTARRIVRVQGVDQRQQIVRLHRRSAFDADRVLDPAHELDMGPVQLARALADPQHVGRGVEPFARTAVQPRQGALDIQQQGLVRGEDLDPAQVRMGLGRDADGLHEGQGLGDLLGQFAVLGPRRRCRRNPASSGGCCTGRHSRRRQRRAAGSGSRPTGCRRAAAAADRASALPA